MQGRQDYVQMLAHAIRSERERQAFTQEDFARYVGLDRGYMGGVERGQHNLTFSKLMVVLQGLRAEPAQFFRDIHLRRHASGEARVRPGKYLKRSLSKLESFPQMLGIAVRDERVLAGLTQKELARQTGLARSYISGIECARRNPTFAKLMQVLEGLLLEPADFFQHFPLPGKHMGPTSPMRGTRNQSQVGSLTGAELRAGPPPPAARRRAGGASRTR